MWVGVLGPLRVRDEQDCEVAISSGKQGVVLAALTVRANLTVSLDELIATVWDGRPPQSEHATLRNYIKRLRQSLGEGGVRLTTWRGGYYSFRLGNEELDLSVFKGLYESGGSAVRAGEWQQAWELLGKALSLWRGPFLTDVESDTLRRDHGPALEKLRLQAAEWHADAGLALGRHAEVAAELPRMVAEHPLRERFSTQLMLALSHSGRTGEALTVFRHTRQMLIGELGLEPGSELQEVHKHILSGNASALSGRAISGDQMAGAAGRSDLAGPDGLAVPRELPGAVRLFMDRRGELATLTESLRRETAGSAPISVISGVAGVGKTALALHWAHQAGASFPHGWLYVNLHGYDDGQQVRPVDALTGFLRALDVPWTEIPSGLDECAARYRSLAAGRQMLVMLDNAASAEQVRPLLPGTTTCVTIITSRDSLAGLVARDGAERVELGPLPATAAVALLRALIGRRVDDDPRAAQTLAAQCGNLPLALRVTAELAAAQPAVSLAALATDIADPQQRLDPLDANAGQGPANWSVSAWSYRRAGTSIAPDFRPPTSPVRSVLGWHESRHALPSCG
jgi:DNA-binding SARP family transcriptional activator